MRKTDEVEMFRKVREEFPGSFTDRGQPGRDRLANICEELGMNQNRFWYIVEKWSRKGLWDYGVSLPCGWFTDTCPKADAAQ